MRNLLPAIGLSLALSACGSNEEPTVKTSVTTPAVVKKTVAPISIVISSVLLNLDCPEPAQPAAREMMPADQPNAKMQGDQQMGFAPSCEQSTVQIAFAGKRDTATPISIGAIRLLSKDGKVLESISARSPMRWVKDSYATWDGVLPANTELKASYKLSAPNWSEVAAKVGGSSYGPMFVIEVEFQVGETKEVVRSQPFVRVKEVMIQT